jgi:anti-anti-sigma factor
LDGGGVEIQPVLAVVVEHGNPAVVKLVGEFDLSEDSAVRARFSELDGDVNVDCSGVDFIDSSGLQVLVDANTACAARGATLVLVDPSECVQRLLNMAGLHAWFRVRSSEPAP